MESFLGQIILWPLPWAPAGWLPCDGRLLPIAQNTALYSLLGTVYGGNGTTTFALPDLRMKFPAGAQAMNQVGMQGGASTADLSGVRGIGSLTIGVNNLPSHSHGATFAPGAAANVSVSVPVDSVGAATDSVPGNNKVLATGQAGSLAAKVYSTDAPNTTLAPFTVEVPASTGNVAVDNTGGGQPLPVQVALSGTVNTLSPFLTLNFIIAVQGIYPSRP